MNVNKKTILSIIGALILGALGNGLWELVKPLLGWGGSFLLTAATLGLDSLRDGIYAAVPNAVVRQSGSRMTSQSLGSLIAFSAFAVMFFIKISVVGRLNTLGAMLINLFGALTLVLIVASYRSHYVEYLALYTTKLESMAAPYLSDSELKQLRDSLVRIDSRQAYLLHVKALRKAIEAAGRDAPVRDFF